MTNFCFSPAEIALPDFRITDGARWSCVACDQYTSQPEYWEGADALVGDAPSTLRLILPEVYLSETDTRVPLVHKAMEAYLKNILIRHPASMILLERTLGDGKIRRGIVGMIDLEDYDYRPGASSLIRATEQTVPERIPPRMVIRREAAVELPHVMLLIDDRQHTVIEPLFNTAASRETAYDHPLMQESGHVRGFWLTAEEQAETVAALSALVTPEAMETRYGKPNLAPLLFAVGDGNHSLAAAKACYTELKEKLGDAALTHPRRYALVEVVNLYDESLEFEPIYRVVFGVNTEQVIKDFLAYIKALDGNATPHDIHLCHGELDMTVTVSHPVSALAVGTVQSFFDSYPLPVGAEVDYIHGENVARSLGSKENALAFLFDGMTKEELFSTVISDGSLPRKTFSMGHAADKRFYTEARVLG